jgi:uncharacterized protein DUF748
MRASATWLSGWVRRHRLAVGVIVAVLVLAFLVAFALDEPIRRTVEHEMNQRLKGYTVHIRSANFHPIGFALDLDDIVMVQSANPDPPVMKLTRLHASVQWSAIIHARVVGDFLLDRPIVYVNRVHFEREVKDPTPLPQHGWQDALQAAYPLKINEFTIREGDITYVETEQARPLRIRRFNATAHDIRNVRSEPKTYPSPLHAEAVVFDDGKLIVDGAADFLAEPFAGIKGEIDLQRIALDYFKPVLARYNLVLARGVLSAKGQVEYAPTVKIVELEDLAIDDVQAEYLYKERTAEVAKGAAQKTAQAAKDVSNAPDILIRAKQARVTNGAFTFVHKETAPEYRLFIANTNLNLQNFSNQKSDGLGTVSMSGRFMGTGAATVKAAFRPENNGPNFNLEARIQNTDLRSLNDLLRAYAKIDVAAGVFSVFTELSVKNGTVNGYVKPLFRDLQVYDPEKDKGKPLGAKVKEKVVGGAAKILKNRPRREVATVADISGPVGATKTDTLRTVLRLVENAFFKAILPGFEREVRAPRGAREG